MSARRRRRDGAEDDAAEDAPPPPAEAPASTPAAPDDDPNAVKYHCDYCRKDISSGIRIKCAQCTDFDLCVECFSVGVEVTPHQNNHAYQVMDRVNFPLFDEEWEAEEELLLLEAISKYGLGNWEDVADHVGTKTLDECREHYFQTYINSATAPLPDTSLVLTSSETLQARKRQSDERAKARGHQSPAKRAKKASNARSQKPSGAQQSSKTLPGQAPPQQIGVVGGVANTSATGASYASAPVSLEQAGFMPLRGEFEVEYENDAESLISPLTFDDDDTPEETEIKYKMLELYSQKLMQRYTRREFVISRGLMNIKRLQAREREMGEDRDLYLRMRVFVQVLSADDFDRFVDSIITERRLRRRIETLQQWRHAGCRTLAAGERFMSEFQRRHAESHSLRRGRQEAVSGAAQAVAEERRRRLDALAKWNQKVPKARKASQRLIIDDLPAASLLTPRETDLCSELRLYPKQYLLVKDTLLRLGAASNGNLKRNQVRQHVTIDPNKVMRIFDFMEQCGWLNSATRIQNAQADAQRQLAEMQQKQAQAAAAAAAAANNAKKATTK